MESTRRKFEFIMRFIFIINSLQFNIKSANAHSQRHYDKLDLGFSLNYC